MDKETLKKLRHVINQHVRLHSKVSVSATYMGIEVEDIELLVNNILEQLNPPAQEVHERHIVDSMGRN